MSTCVKAGAAAPAFIVANCFGPRRNWPLFLLLALLLFSAPAQAAYRDGVYHGEELFAKTPLLNIAYCAESRGEVRPCAGCGGTIGGLARRASFIAQLRGEPAPLLFVLGPGEFSADLSAEVQARRAKEWQLPEEQTPGPGKILAAYSALRPQAAYLSPEAGRWFRAAQLKIPDFFVPVGTAESRAVSRVIDIGGRKIGLLFFAPSDGSGKARAEALFAGRQLAPRVHLLVGISPWGFEEERDFLPEAAGLFHVLLGGGAGPGFAAASSAQAGQLIWSRPAVAGAGVNLVSIYRWPGAGPLHWESGMSYEARQEILGKGMREDAEIARLLAP